MARRDIVLGLDCGTSSAKALAIDRRGGILAEARSPIPLREPGQRLCEQEAEDWWKASLEALTGAAAAAGPERVAGIAISHQRESFAALDADGRPLRPAMLWMDARAAPLLESLRASLNGLLGPGGFRAATGKVLSANLSLGKIEWMRLHEPALFERAALFLDVQAYLALRLCGRAVTGWGSADPTGLFDMGARTWSEPIMAAVGLEAGRLPEVMAPGTPIGGLLPEAARACGLDAGIPLVCGLGDGQAAGLGAGILGPGESYLSLGTSIVSGTWAPACLDDPGFRASFGGVPGSYYLETVILGGSSSLDWFDSRYARAAEDPARAEGSGYIADLPPGVEGLLFLPYLRGAMGPQWDARASGALVGLRPCHGPAHVRRAIMEGLAMELRLQSGCVEEALARVGGAPSPIRAYVAAGGGARDTSWLGIIADATGRPVRSARTEECAALGAGMLAAAGAGLHPSVAEAARAMAGERGEAVLPDPSRAEAYTRIFQNAYVGLYPALRSCMRGLDEACGLEGP
jgi:xylulokinase